MNPDELSRVLASGVGIYLAVNLIETPVVQILPVMPSVVCKQEIRRA